MREIELKLAVDGTFVLPDLVDVDASIVEIDELPTQHLRALYYDTEDLRLARHGITIRHRSGDEQPGWTLKFPVDLGGVAIRDEFVFDAEASEMPPEASSLVTAYTRGEALVPVARLQTRRRRCALRGADEEELAEVVDDEVSVLEGGEVVSRFREIEVESRKGDISLLERLAHALRNAGALNAEPVPKAVRALGARATAPSDLPPLPSLSPDEPAALAVQAALVKGVRRIIANDPGVRLGEPESVHQMRVGARRLRSDLRTFLPLVHSYWANDLIEELKWIADHLGAVRDVDVFKENVERMAPDLLEDLARLFESLDTRHATARKGLTLALNSERYVKLLDHLGAVASHPHLTAAASDPCAEALPPLVKASWKRLAKSAGRLDPDSSPEEFHDARIKAKRVRYAAEAVGPALGQDREKAERFADLVADLQDVLGEHQDALIACKILADTAACHPDDARLNLAVGRLIERETVKAKECRESFSKVWGRLSLKKRRKWFDT